LGIFRKHAFNLTSIDTRPSRVRPWHYIFFVECEQAKKVSDATDRAEVDGLMSDLGEVAQSCRHLGRWSDELDRIETKEGPV
jgi:prephenate dehydratase